MLSLDEKGGWIGCCREINFNSRENMILGFDLVLCPANLFAS